MELGLLTEKVVGIAVVSFVVSGATFVADDAATPVGAIAPLFDGCAGNGVETTATIGDGNGLLYGDAGSGEFIDCGAVSTVAVAAVAAAASAAAVAAFAAAAAAAAAFKRC